MRGIAIIAAAAVATSLLAGCAGGYGMGFGGPAYYDGYYDGTYGPIYDGYWSGDAFYYRDSADHPFVQDTGGHFKRQAASGYNHIHGQRHAAPHGDHHADRPANP